VVVKPGREGEASSRLEEEGFVESG
jgi:hypothetical protein